MQYDQYHNCLRLQITMDDMQDERIDLLAEHCQKYGFDNVMLMLNLEEFNRGHILLEEAKAWVEVLKKAKRKLEDCGITVSVNNWMELGHADRGRTFFENQNFCGMVDMYGKESMATACPLDENWCRYFEEYTKYLVRELKPDTFWIEDDFRLHNHAPLQGIGCYCKNHMKAYNERLHTNYTREEFLEKVFAPGGCNPERKVWLDVNRDAIISLAKRIKDAVKSANPETDVALMSSTPGMHCLEARDWKRLFDVIGQDGKKIHRIHLCYGETSGKDTISYFNAISMPIRAMTEVDVFVLPEIEHGPASLYARSPRFFRFAMECAIPLVLSGMTYSIYDFVGNGVRESFGYGEEVYRLRSYMQAIMDLHLDFSSLTGVVIPMEPKACYFKTMNREYEELIPNEFEIGAYLSGLGISYQYSREREFQGKAVYLCGSSMDYFNDSELKKVFENNYVLLDGSGALKLQERELLSLISARNVRLVEAESGYHTYEECEDSDFVICGVRNLRASCRGLAGNFTDITYDEHVLARTGVYNQYMQRLAPGFAQGEGFAITPYCIHRRLYSQYCDLRKYFVTRTIMQQTNEFAYCDIAGVSPYLYRREKDWVLVLLNGNVESYEEIPLHLGQIRVTRVSYLDANGEFSQVPYEYREDMLVVKNNMEYLSSRVLIFE